jgi:hypothetical protein
VIALATLVRADAIAHQRPVDLPAFEDDSLWWQTQPQKLERSQH